MSRRKNSLPEPGSPPSDWQRALIGGVVILAAACLVYVPCLKGGFIWDDEGLVLNRVLMHRWDGLYKIWFTASAPDYWPVTYTLWWIEWQLWPTSLLGYHAVNLVLHGFSCLMVWAILKKMSMPGAFLAALLYAVHPVNVESVAWIAQGKDVLAVAFFLVSIYWYLQSEEKLKGSGIRGGTLSF